jgi:hypothetical protein
VAGVIGPCAALGARRRGPVEADDRKSADGQNPRWEGHGARARNPQGWATQKADGERGGRRMARGAHVHERNHRRQRGRWRMSLDGDGLERLGLD